MHLVNHQICINPTTLHQILLPELHALPGIQRVELSQHRLILTYDVVRLQWTQIDGLLTRHSAFRHSLGDRLRRSWYSFSDTNLKDNTTYKRHCCNRPPR